ncbi:MAG TPA: N-6 DNA methylase [Anaerolineaceae bacterium]|nr:N-6 DNA methylase [Anaerolineaceae bacterium]
MPQFDPVKLESFVQIRAPQIAKDIQTAAAKAHNEADLVAETEKILEKFATNFDIQLNLQRERTLINGRADAVYNRFVIEYEPPRSLTKSNTHRNNKHAIEQVQNYMAGLERLDRQKKERLAGVALDGSYYIFIRYRDDHWNIDDPIPVNSHSSEKFLRYLLALSTELALTPENLVRDFGENSNVARRVVPALYRAITTTQNKKADVLFRQWLHQFREVSGYDPEGSQLNTRELGRLYAVNEKHIDLEKLFFSIHTYYAAFIKLLALQVAYYYLMPKMGSGLRGAANETEEKLCKFLQNMERGGLFAELGIKNFLEGDFFGWYLDIWDENLYVAFQRLVGDLANYSLVTLDVDPEETRDLLKQLYQNLVPRELRHALGEYYTPDWLAERLLNQLGYDGDPKIRLLDPACGSGTFLVLAIKRVHAYADEKMLPPAQVLDQVLQNIVGFDLNPLAVISSRTNYLLALGDLLQHRNGDITIPVYLADSILTPTQGTDLFTQNAYSFSTAVGKFSVPRVLVQANYISQLADLLEECVHVNLDPTLFEQRLINMFGMKRPDDENAISVTLTLYNQLIELEKQGINGIWARIIKNAFAPIFQPKFDLIAGNPPWVNWENLPEDYRQETIPLWEFYGLFPHKGMDAILGKGKKDISMLMTYVAIDKYLKDNGKLGFVITQTVFKSTGAGQGFRRFKLADGTPIKIVGVDDMAFIKPFKDASNRTSIVIMVKNQVMTYPLNSYLLWYKPDGGLTINETITLEYIVKNKVASYRQFLAEPVDENDKTSSWLTAPRAAFKSIRTILGKSEYEAHLGVNAGGASGIYWLDLISTNPDGTLLVSNKTECSKKKLDSVQVRLEPELVYPLVRERGIKKWHYIQNDYLLFVQDPDRRKGYDERWLSTNYPKTYGYLKYFEEFLRDRPAYNRYYSTKDPFYSMFNVGNYTMSDYKVAWSRLEKTINACVISKDNNGKLIIPQETISFIACDSKDEADYLCGILNSAMFNFAVQSYSMTGGKSFGTPNILENINVPKFDPSNEKHMEIVNLSRKAQELTSQNDTENLEIIENQIDRVTGEVWNMNENDIKELKEIQVTIY